MSLSNITTETKYLDITSGSVAIIIIVLLLLLLIII